MVAKDDGIDVDFRLRTEGDLSDADLPIAPGDEAPDVIKRRARSVSASGTSHTS